MTVVASTDDTNQTNQAESTSTSLNCGGDPLQFVLRYGAAIRAYLRVLLPSQDAADEVEQDFMLQVFEKGFSASFKDSRRFRLYLNAVVRNAAWAWFRQRRQDPHIESDITHIAVKYESVDQGLSLLLRETVLKNAWQALRAHQSETKGNLFESVLRAAVDFQGEDSAALAMRVSTQTGRPLKADAFRKQLSRARRCLAELMVTEVSRMFENPTPELIEEELRDLDFLKYVRGTLPKV